MNRDGTNRRYCSVERAAEFLGVTFADFVLESAHNAAMIVVQEHDMLCLRDEARNVFFDAIVNPPEPNEHAKSAVAQYRAVVRS